MEGCQEKRRHLRIGVCACFRDFIVARCFGRSSAAPPRRWAIARGSVLMGNIFFQMEKTLKTFSKVLRGPELSGYLNGVTERYRAAKPPMNKREWQNFLDCEGRLVQPIELRRSVFRGGIEPSLRSVSDPYTFMAASYRNQCARIAANFPPETFLFPRGLMNTSRRCSLCRLFGNTC